MAVSVPGNSCRPCTNVSATTGCPIRVSGACVYYSGSALAGPAINVADTFDTVVNKLTTYIQSVPVPSTFTPKRVPFASSSGILTTDPNLFFDDPSGNGNTQQLVVGPQIFSQGGFARFNVTNDQTMNIMEMNTFGTGQPVILSRRALGSYTSPTAVTSGSDLFVVSGRGYGATGFSASGRASILLTATQTWTDTAQGAKITFRTTTNGTATSAERMVIDNTGNVGIGVTAPTAVLHLKAGTATANTAPVKLTSGTLLTTPETGVVEYDGSRFYGTVGSDRRVLDNLYKVYAAIVTQSGTNNPVPTVLENTLGVTITWTRDNFSGAGNYFATASSAIFLAGKAVMFTGSLNSPGFPVTINSNTSQFSLITYNSSAAAADNLLSTFVEIRVYP